MNARSGRLSDTASVSGRPTLSPSDGYHSTRLGVDFDAVVRLGFGRRLAVFGPFAVADLAGLDVWASIFDLALHSLDGSTATPSLLADRVREARLGAKSGVGFYPWPAEELERALATRDQELLCRLAAESVVES